MNQLCVFLRVVGCGVLLQASSAVWAQSSRPDDARTCALNTGQAAIESCTRAIASHRFSQTELALLHYRRAMLLRDANDLGRAIGDFSTAIHLNGDVMPMSADAFDLRISQRNAYTNRGRTYEDQKDYARALADYEVLLKADPTDPLALSRRAWTLERAGACERALADFDALIANDPKVWDSYLGRARCRTQRGNRDGAIADYRAALALPLPDAVKPDVQSALQELGATP